MFFLLKMGWVCLWTEVFFSFFGLEFLNGQKKSLGSPIFESVGSAMTAIFRIDAADILGSIFISLIDLHLKRRCITSVTYAETHTRWGILKKKQGAPSYILFSFCMLFSKTHILYNTTSSSVLPAKWKHFERSALTIDSGTLLCWRHWPCLQLLHLLLLLHLFLKESPWTNMIMRKIYDFCWVEVPAPFFKRLIQPAITFLLKMYVHENAIL